MASRKFTLGIVMTAALVLACIPAFAGAAPLHEPSYNAVQPGDKVITGSCVDAETLKFTFLNGATAQVTAAGD